MEGCWAKYPGTGALPRVYTAVTQLPAAKSAIHRESSSYGVDFWREAEGFAQSRVRAIVQTRDGYIRLGTDGGLVRFNVDSFTTFTTQTGALKNNEVWALQEDGAGGRGSALMVGASRSSRAARSGPSPALTGFPTMS